MVPQDFNLPNTHKNKHYAACFYCQILPEVYLIVLIIFQKI